MFCTNDRADLHSTGYMNVTTYSETTNIASIQPGSDWGMVYIALETYDVTVAGGRADVVGVGGFTTGGGYSFYSGSTGWACDNVYNFEVVLGNGSVLNVDEEQTSDLFQAMKGSSGNLALVTRVDMCKSRKFRLSAKQSLLLLHLHYDS